MGILDQIDPRDIKVATVIAVAYPTNFAAPANNIATRHRYLLAVNMGNQTVASAPGLGLEDINGNLIWSSLSWVPPFGQVFNTPIPVGIPGQNGLRVSLLSGVVQQSYWWVQFADVKAPLTAEIFRS